MPSVYFWDIYLNSPRIELTNNQRVIFVLIHLLAAQGISKNPKPPKPGEEVYSVEELYEMIRPLKAFYSGKLPGSK